MGEFSRSMQAICLGRSRQLQSTCEPDFRIQEETSQLVGVRVHTAVEVMLQFSCASQIRMSSPSLHDLVERLERLEIASTTASIAARPSQGPYNPPVIAPTLHIAILEICQKDEAQIDEPMKFHQV